MCSYNLKSPYTPLLEIKPTNRHRSQVTNSDITTVHVSCVVMTIANDRSTNDVY